MNAFTSILAIIPAIIAAIKAIEASIPNAVGAGKDKLDAVINIITSIDNTLIQYIPQLSAVIGVLVKLFNAVGLFKAPVAPTV